MVFCQAYWTEVRRVYENDVRNMTGMNFISFEMNTSINCY